MDLEDFTLNMPTKHHPIHRYLKIVDQLDCTRGGLGGQSHFTPSPPPTPPPRPRPRPSLKGAAIPVIPVIPPTTKTSDTTSLPASPHSSSPISRPSTILSSLFEGKKSANTSTANTSISVHPDASIGVDGVNSADSLASSERSSSSCKSKSSVLLMPPLSQYIPLWPSKKCISKNLPVSFLSELKKSYC
jgi:hypothetical protein